MITVNRRRVMAIPPEEPLPYLCFTALEDGTFKHNTDALEYSLDGGVTWVSLAAATNTPTVTAGNSILWRGEMTPGNKNQWFISSKKFDASGNPLSLIYKDKFRGKPVVDYSFFKLFMNCSKLVNAKDIIIPSDFDGKTNVCARMFQSCTSLISAPEIPATVLTASCYHYMFIWCTALQTAPNIPATTMAHNCCNNMFYGCTALINTQETLSASLATGCYASMFYGCTSLTTAPNLPITTLATYCYENMFRGCTSLTTAPVLPATTLAGNCYNNMFNGCSNLNYIKALFTTTPSTSYTNGWVNGVAATGTFVKNSSATWNVTGVNGVPSGWTVQTASS